MEKLIELLNQCEYDRRGEKQLRGYTGGMFYYIQSCKDYLDLKIISKEYGFIKRLVENDKIDRDKILKENGQFRVFFYDLERVKNYDRLVMYLSVEDKPIKFLISILK